VHAGIVLHCAPICTHPFQPFLTHMHLLLPLSPTCT
jgi:hypothetical protein